MDVNEKVIEAAAKKAHEDYIAGAEKFFKRALKPVQTITLRQNELQSILEATIKTYRPELANKKTKFYFLCEDDIFSKLIIEIED